jgi:PleD family two-component response regulator
MDETSKTKKLSDESQAQAQETGVAQEKSDLSKLVKNEPSHDETDAKTSEEIDVLLYVRSPLLAKIYERILQSQGLKVEGVWSENELIDAMDRKRYHYVLIDSTNLDADDTECIFIETLIEAGVEPYIFASEGKRPSLNCAEIIDVSHFSDEIRKYLHKGE